MSQQLALRELQLHEDSTFENFLPSTNAELVRALNNAAHGRGEHYIYFWGERGAGRSHLLQACCHVARSLHLGAMYLPLSDIVASSKSEVFTGLESLHLVCLDDVDNLAGKPEWEEALFHLFNRIKDLGHRLVISGKLPPKQLDIQLKDLASRLSWGVVYHLEALSDNEKVQALHFRAQVRGFDMPVSVIEFLLKHHRRDMHSLFDALNQLDDASFEKQRKLTIPFVKQVLSI